MTRRPAVEPMPSDTVPPVGRDTQDYDSEEALFAAVRERLEQLRVLRELEQAPKK